MGKQEKNRSQKKKHVKRLRELARGLGKTREEEALTNMRICIENGGYAGMQKYLSICLKSKKIKSDYVKSELVVMYRFYNPSLLQRLKKLFSESFSIVKKHAKAIETFATVIGAFAVIVEAIRKICG